MARKRKTPEQKTAWRMILELTGDGFLSDPERIDKARKCAGIVEGVRIPTLEEENKGVEYTPEVIAGIREDYAENIGMTTIANKWKVALNHVRMLVADPELEERRNEKKAGAALSKWTDEQIEELKKAYVEGAVMKALLPDYGMSRYTFAEHVKTDELLKQRKAHKKNLEKRGRAEIVERRKNGEKLESLYADFGQALVYKVLKEARQNDRQSIKLKVTDLETGAERYYRSIKQAARCMAFPEHELRRMVIVGESPEGCLMEVIK